MGDESFEAKVEAMFAAVFDPSVCPAEVEPQVVEISSASGPDVVCLSDERDLRSAKKALRRE